MAYSKKSTIIMALAGLAMVAIILLINRSPAPGKRVLPILGERDFVNGDTVYATIPDFQFIDQDSQIVNNATFAGKIYIADFFFIHCPSICPKVKKNGQRIYEKYKNDDRFLMLSHSIDPRHDTVAALRVHARKLDIDAHKWHLVTGDHDAIYAMADKYEVAAKEDPDAPGGFDHSGKIILVDKNRRVRAFCDGTDAADVDRFMLDIDLLLEEEFGPAKAAPQQ